MELIDEMKSHLPIPAYASKDLSKYLITNGINITPETEFMITDVVESGDEGGIMCLLDVMNPESFVISITLLRVKPDHPLFDRISAYQKQRIRSIIRSKGLRPRRR
ncbi:MAG: hypothetical protein E4G89_04935 [Methanothrix sp.]|nr:MAG: hypothetical protein E4G89_04935 [Methanothrix sp.]